MKVRLCLWALLLIPGLAWAQSGSLKGKVLDKTTKEPLVGATIFIVGTYKGGTTNLDGEYIIKDIKPGDYTIRVSSVGYVEKLFTGIRISKDQTTDLNVSLADQTITKETVEIVGERNVVDLESGKSEVRIGSADIKEMTVRNVQDIVAMQAGVSQSPDGLQIRGGRTYETTYLVDGISASDPLAGTGFGTNVSSSAIQDVSVTTGGADAEYGGTSGVIATRVKEGGDKWSVSGTYQSDNLGLIKRSTVNSWNTDLAEVAFGGPIPFTNNKVKIFVSANYYASDNYFGSYAKQLRSSIMENDEFWAPRQDNKWGNTIKLSYKISDGVRLSVLNQHSIMINQNTRTLQIIGFDQIMTPGFQYAFTRQLDNATTYTHRSNLTAATLNVNLSKNWGMEMNLGRLFTNLRADANGAPFNTETVDRIYDPRSVVTDPVLVFDRPVPAPITFVLPGDGLINNNGLSSLWHDHYAQEYTVKYKFNYFSPSKAHFISFGQEHKEQEYQWVDVTSPWVGASIRLPDGSFTPTLSIGSSNDIWKAKPATGNFFFQDEIRYKGIIATLGGRFEYWAPGKFADNAIDNNDRTNALPQAVVDDYRSQTVGFLDGRRYKARFLPRLRVSFPVSENQVLYFNYGHSMRLPHPRFVYAGLDPLYASRSFLSDLGNPNLNPEVAVSYEVGLKSQITRDFGFTATAFYKDYFDYIVNRSVQVPDATGQLVEKTFSINQDYARVRGVELGFNYRLSRTLRTTLNAGYQVASGKSNTAAESRLQIRNTGGIDLTKEQPLAWDRPFDIKVGVIFTPDSTFRLAPFLRGFRFFLFSTFKSGIRYTPVVRRGTSDLGRPIYEQVENDPNSRIGTSWFWTDLRITRDVRLPGTRSVVSLSVEIRNLFNNLNSQIINPVTGTAYRSGDPLPFNSRDPFFASPQDSGTPPSNPARYLEPRQILFGAAFSF